MIVNLFGILGLMALFVWTLLVLSSHFRKIFYRICPFNRGDSVLAYGAALGLGVGAVWLHCIYFNVAGEHIKKTILPFGSSVLSMLMYTGVGSSLLTTMPLFGKIKLIVGYCLGLIIGGFWFFSKGELLPLGIFWLIGLLPFILAYFLLKTDDCTKQ